MYALKKRIENKDTRRTANKKKDKEKKEEKKKNRIRFFL
jgi:hypothetical protein